MQELRMQRIPPGTFFLGMPPSPDNANLYHRWHSGKQVRIAAFEIGIYPVTVRQYQSFIRETDHAPASECKIEGNKPVGNVSWEDAQAYCAWLSRKTGQAYRLPTDAEWEYAARGGQEGMQFPWGNDLDDRHAWYGGKSGAIAVGSFEPNGYGLYDVIGNVWEWCEDRFNDVSSGVKAKNAPTGRDLAENRVLRGGSYLTTNPLNLWIAYRHEDPPDLRHECIGFRIAHSL
jgi:formylglycine-generating enzyme required for sulfatase activity